MSEIKMTLKSVDDKDSEKRIVEVPRPIGNFTVNSRQIPEIKDWQPGQDYVLMIKVRQDSIRVPHSWELNDEDSDIGIDDRVAEFSIIRVEALPADKQPAIEKVLPII